MIDPLNSPTHDTGSNLGLFESGPETRSCVDHVTVDYVTMDHVTGSCDYGSRDCGSCDYGSCDWIM